MNHYDDRVSYFAHLVEQGQYLKCQDTNNQADQSLSAYGGKSGTVNASDMQVAI